MKKDEYISEEQLNAFLDGELDSEEGSCLFDKAAQSSELDQRLCQQRKLKELVKHAYREVPEPKRLLHGQSTPRSLFGLAMVASLLLVVGFTAGMFIHDYLNQGSRPDSFAAHAGTEVAPQSENYLLHVGSGDPKKMEQALQKARDLLASAEPGKPRHIEVVANGQGLDLFRSDVTLFADEISALADASVMFYACANAIDRLEEKGIKVKLVPEANSGFTAVDRVVKRLQDGWNYVKI